MNNVSLIGNLTRDPELRYTAENKPVASFTLAVNRQNDGVDFIDISVWNKQAENCKKYLSKGRKVGVEGSIRTGTYEKDGKNYKSFNIMANKVFFLSNSSQETTNQDKPTQETKTIENESKNEYEEDVYSQFGNSIEITDEEIAF